MTTDADPVVSGRSDSVTNITPDNEADSRPSSVEGHTQEKTGHLIGKIDNLVTSDLTAVDNLFQKASVR